MNKADTVHRDDRFTEGLTRKVLWVINHAGKLASVQVNLHIHSWTRGLQPSQLFFFSLCLAFFSPVLSIFPSSLALCALTEHCVDVLEHGTDVLWDTEVKGLWVLMVFSSDGHSNQLARPPQAVPELLMVCLRFFWRNPLKDMAVCILITTQKHYNIGWHFRYRSILKSLSTGLIVERIHFILGSTGPQVQYLIVSFHAMYKRALLCTAVGTRWNRNEECWCCEVEPWNKGKVTLVFLSFSWPSLHSQYHVHGFGGHCLFIFLFPEVLTMWHHTQCERWQWLAKARSWCKKKCKKWPSSLEV